MTKLIWSKLISLGAVLASVMTPGVAMAADAGSVVVTAAAGAAAGTAVETATTGAADQNQARAAFAAWKKLDTPGVSTIAIPSVQPVDRMTYTSNFGIRSDPFQGSARMHAGVDISGPVGTPIYATADGVIVHADRRGGYGKLVEVDHGKGIATRYGHLSQILVESGTLVKRGQLIGLMGSTGRSTGSHLHYEVRIDGHAVNPTPFLTTGDYLLAAASDAARVIPVDTTAPAPLD